MERKQTVRKKKPAENNEYFLMKDKKQRQKLTYFLVRAVTFRATIIFFVLFDLLFSYWYSYKAGWIISSILLWINSIFMAVEILILKKKIPKIRKLFQRIKMFYLDVVWMFLTFSLFLILIFSIINQPREWKDKPPIKCETYASSWARLGFNNQYRTNQIQNTYPLTFRNVTDLDVEIDKYLNNKYSGWIVK